MAHGAKRIQIKTCAPPKMQREYPDRPIVGVGAVILREGRVVLVRRGREPLRGQWSLPGGALELGETLTAGVVREVLEETGLVVRPLSLAGVFDRILPGENGRPQYHYVLVDYLCEPESGELCAGGDASEVCWCSADELESKGLADFTLELLKKVLTPEGPDSSGLSS